MQRKSFILPSIAVLLLAINTIIAPVVYATEYIISGNGEASVNEIITTVDQNTTVTQTNTAEVTNNIDIKANTGQNTVSDGVGDVQISTGDASTNLAVENNLNSSVVQLGCC